MTLAKDEKSDCDNHEISYEMGGTIVVEEDRWIIDVWCRHCGRSGSFLVDSTTEIAW